jgi:enoyl-CoA hydratase/carnithine racemase
MGYECRIEDGIIIFTIDNGKINAINLEILKALEDAVGRINAQKELKGLVITGKDRYFSGGFDLNTFTSFASGQAIIDWFKAEEEILYKLFTCAKPVVAAVNGHATAAGMIISMACDYRLVVNHPKIKLGMTEIKLGLALSPAEAGIMKFGLDTDKKYRDVILGGELFDPATAVQREIYDELVDDPDELLNKAKAKVSAYIDQPGRSFIGLKTMEKKEAAANIRKEIDTFDWNILIDLFTSQELLNTLHFAKKALGV